MTVNEALQNIDVVVAAARMNRQEHDALKEALGVIVLRCRKADELELKEKERKEFEKATKEVE